MPERRAEAPIESEISDDRLKEACHMLDIDPNDLQNFSVQTKRMV